MYIASERRPESVQDKVDLVVAKLLRIGSTIAGILIAGGLGATVIGVAIGPILVKSGLIVLVATPVLRVAAAFVVFLLERDYTFALISFTVLVAMGAGALLGNIA